MAITLNAGEHGATTSPAKFSGGATFGAPRNASFTAGSTHYSGLGAGKPVSGGKVSASAPQAQPRTLTTSQSTDVSGMAGDVAGRVANFAKGAGQNILGKMGGGGAAAEEGGAAGEAAGAGVLGEAAELAPLALL